MRKIIGEANLIVLNKDNLSQKVISDSLFKGIFETKTLIHSVILKINLRGDAGEGKIFDDTLLGDLTLKTSKEIITTIPLRFLKRTLEVMGLIKEIATREEYILYLPFPFASLMGIRPKDTFRVAEGCLQYFIEINGNKKPEWIIDRYTILPIILGEKSFNVSLPSKGEWRYGTDYVPAGVWYKSKIEIGGFSLLALSKSDYSSLDGVAFSLEVDGEKRYEISNITDLNFIDYYLFPSRFMNLKTRKDIVFIHPTLDKKLAKVSRNSRYYLNFKSDNPFTLQVLYLSFEGLSADESKELAKIQGVDVERENLMILPVGHTGAIRANAKPLYRKIAKATGEPRKRGVIEL